MAHLADLKKLRRHYAYAKIENNLTVLKLNFITNYGHA